MGMMVDVGHPIRAAPRVVPFCRNAWSEGPCTYRGAPLRGYECGKHSRGSGTPAKNRDQATDFRMDVGPFLVHRQRAFGRTLTFASHHFLSQDIARDGIT
jgi:hypothetical protein